MHPGMVQRDSIAHPYRARALLRRGKKWHRAPSAPPQLDYTDISFFRHPILYCCLMIILYSAVCTIYIFSRRIDREYVRVVRLKRPILKFQGGVKTLYKIL